MKLQERKIMDKHLKRIVKILYEEYYETLIKIAIKLKSTIYYSIPLEKMDLINFALVDFVKNDLYKYDPKKKISFKNFFLTKIKFSMMRYSNKFNSKNHQILNNSFDYKDELNRKEETSKRIIINYSCLDKLEMKLINDLFFENKSKQAIAKELLISEQKVLNTLEKALKKLKKTSYLNY